MAGLVQHLDELEFTKDKKERERERESIIFHILSYIKMLKSNLM